MNNGWRVLDTAANKLMWCLIWMLGGLCAFALVMTVLTWLSGPAHASQSAPDDMWAVQCLDDKCYYVTGKEVPPAVLAKYEKQMTEEMAKSNQEGADGE